MLSDFQREKISHYFRIVLDQDKNGVLEENDFRGNWRISMPVMGF